VTAPVAFDLDGCLIDSVPAILPSMRVSLDAHGIDVPPDDALTTLIGPPLEAGVRELLGVDAETARSIVRTYRADYRQHMFDRTALQPGVADAVRAIAALRTLCIVTSKPAALAGPILDHLGLLDAFAFVEGPSLDMEAETKAVTLQRAMERLDVAVIVGDRHHDVDAGRACGIATIGVLWGMGDAGELAGADHVVRTPDELVEVLS
jgi:phosphoglycolate phosphatase